MHKKFEYLEMYDAVADPGFGQGGGRDFADVAKQSLARKANNIIFQYKRIWEI